jgi:hypothetical protein
VLSALKRPFSTPMATVRILNIEPGSYDASHGLERERVRAGVGKVGELSHRGSSMPRISRPSWGWSP